MRIRPPRFWRRLRLGTRLALVLGVLALVVFYLVGASTVTNMNVYLLRRLDDQITQVQFEQIPVSGQSTSQALPLGWYSGVVQLAPDGTMTPDPAGKLPPDLQPLGSLVKSASSRHVTRAGSVWGLSPDSPLGPSEYQGRTSLWGPMKYRVRATPLPNSSRVLVTAAPQGDLDYGVHKLVIVEAVTFVVALVVLIIAGRAVLRRGLRPLGDMANISHDIASTDLTGNVAHLAMRVSGRGGGREIEELRSAFNVMLAHIDSSLAARSAAEQRIRRFVADASHELRTPLTSIRGYADLFRYAAAHEPAERDAHLARMREEAARMSLLLDDLMLLARLDSADAPLRAEPVDLVELVTSAADAFRAAHSDHPLTLAVEHEHVALQGDPVQLRQVLDNLLTNAAVHTPAGTDVTVVVRSEPDAAIVEISDTGPGIPANDQGRIFDRFYRVDNSRTRGATRRGADVGGTGLGLSVVQSVVAAHGGTVTLDSSRGRTTFTVRLPGSATTGE